MIIALRDFCRAQHSWLIDTIESLVRLESPTTDKAAVDRCGVELQKRLDAYKEKAALNPRKRGPKPKTT